MKIRWGCNIFLLLCLCHSQLLGSSYLKLALENHVGDSKKTNADSKSQESKKYEDDLILGYFIAVVPGFIVHGAGNMYAGNWTRGLILLGGEIVSLAGLFMIGMAGLGEGEADRGSGFYTLEAFSLALFFGTWVWDIATVGSQIKKRHPDVQIGIGAIGGFNDYKSKPIIGIKLGVRF